MKHLDLIIYNLIIIVTFYSLLLISFYYTIYSLLLFILIIYYSADAGVVAEPYPLFWRESCQAEAAASVSWRLSLGQSGLDSFFFVYK